jgi:geranylgeranyl pyrophosphate synthase
LTDSDFASIQPTEKFRHTISKLRGAIDGFLLDSVCGFYPANLYEPIEYFLKLGGKRLRPLLTLLSAQAVGGSFRKAIPAAAAIELLHNFTLVHDDIMDQDSLRRGKATIHTKWNEAVAILAGDGLIGLAYRALLKTPRHKQHRVFEIFTNGVIKVCEGQAIDKEFEDREEVSLEEYFDMIQKKTGELIAISTEIGGIIGGGSEEQISALKGFGSAIGRAFQIQDDILDIVSSESVLGKDLGSDLAQGKKTFAIVTLKKNAPQDKWEIVRNILHRSHIDHNTLDIVKKILEEYKVLKDAERQIGEDIKRARNCIMSIDNGSWGKELLEFSLLILNRTR